MLKASCLCLTYNRFPSHRHLLEEAVEAFLRQDYHNRELVIVNDTPGQEISFNHPRVVVVNLPRRCHSLGEKYNVAACLSSGDLLLSWDDDDISLPWRISTSVELLGDADYYNPRRHWFLDCKGLHWQHSMGLCHNASVFTRRAFNQVGGYAHVSGPQDALMDQELMRRLDVAKAKTVPLLREEWFYIYRWLVSPNHLSARVDHEGWYRQVGRQPVQQGTYVLQPHWREDYTARCREVDECT